MRLKKRPAAFPAVLPTSSRSGTGIAELRAALRRALTDAAGAPALDALVMAAAVADFTPARPATTKLTRGERLTLELEPTPDLLAEIEDVDEKSPRGVEVQALPLPVGEMPASASPLSGEEVVHTHVTSLGKVWLRHCATPHVLWLGSS